MKIESIIQRKKGTTVDMDGETYKFRPSTLTSSHVAEVKDKRHIAKFLAIPEGFQVFDPDEQDAADEITDTTKKDPAELLPGAPAKLTVVEDGQGEGPDGDKTKVDDKPVDVHVPEGESGLDAEAPEKKTEDKNPNPKEEKPVESKPAAAAPKPKTAKAKKKAKKKSGKSTKRTGRGK